MESHAGENSVKKTKRSKSRASRPRDPVTQALEENLRVVLATKASVRLRRGGSGVIEVPFRNHEDFERVFHLITGQEVSEVVS